jgi:hypothetical protein
MGGCIVMIMEENSARACHENGPVTWEQNFATRMCQRAAVLMLDMRDDVRPVSHWRPVEGDETQASPPASSS